VPRLAVALVTALTTVAGCAARPSRSAVADRRAAVSFLQGKADAIAHVEHDRGVILAIIEPAGRVVGATSGSQSDGQPIPLNGRVRIGSVTKTFVAALALELVDDGKLELDAPAKKYVSMSSNATVRDLLQHTSGLPRDTEPGFDVLLANDPGRAIDPRRLLESIADTPPLFAPGKRWNYSNIDYFYLGLILESVTGTTVAELLRTKITQPLGLGDTYLAGSGPGLPVIRTPIRNGDRTYPYDHPYTSVATKAWTSGAMVSSARDLGTFFEALFKGALISGRALAQMKTVAAGSESTSPRGGYGLGLSQWRPVEFPNVTLYGNGGGIPGFATLVFHDEATGFTYFAAATDLGVDFKPTMLEMLNYTRTHS